ncbi:MAG: hypothetical protein EKK55_22675 [Rhodocyclaceae bacterium]|nr:MAG: hypothetical protein EKK55_22675 [Rhodocyclaceae bacterium]
MTREDMEKIARRRRTLRSRVCDALGLDFDTVRDEEIQARLDAMEAQASARPTGVQITMLVERLARVRQYHQDVLHSGPIHERAVEAIDEAVALLSLLITPHQESQR